MLNQPAVKTRDNIFRLIHSKRYKVISFGLRDFLITYPFWENNDIFWLLQKDFQAVYLKNETQFYPLRAAAEETLKKRSRFGSANLKEIYKYISDTENITLKEADTLLKQECRLLEMYCRRRNFAYEIFEEAKSTDKKIVISSDTSLSKRTVSKILDSCGYEGWDAMYLSSHIHRTKEFGTLFRHMASKQEVYKDEILHIGSDPLRDYYVPEDIGIDAVWVPSSKFQFLHTSIYSYIMQMFAIDGEPWLSDGAFSLRCILAQAADILFDEPKIANVNSIADEEAMGVLLAACDRSDPITEAALKNSNARLFIRMTENLIDHIGSDGNTGINLPLEYIRKYASADEREVFRNYMSENDFRVWEEEAEKDIIQPKNVRFCFRTSGMFPVGTKRRAFLRYLLKI